MWYEYPIPADYETQKRIIRELREWIQGLETRGIVEGFAFNHYSTPQALNLRFDCREEQLGTVRRELEQEIRHFVHNYKPETNERLWDGGANSEYVYKAYEFGTRCVFMFWELIENGRFSEEFTSNFLRQLEANRVGIENINAFNFHFCMGHGIMNSLGISKIPNEQMIHLYSLIESTHSTDSEQLCEWIRNNYYVFSENE